MITRIDPRRLRTLLQNRLYQTVAVRSSIWGGDFIQRKTK